MPATIQHVFNSPIADGTNTQIVRPSDWNSAHALTLNLSGTDMIGGFTNSGNISFSTNTAGYIYADGPGAGTGGGITRVAGGTTFGTGPIISFADGNNITFGMNGNTITASASYVTQTVDTNKAGIGETVGTIAGTDLAMTVNTDGVSIGYPKWLTTAQPVGAYLTTAMQSNAATISNIRVSGGTTSNLLSAITFADGNGVSFGLDAGTVTATVATNYQSQGAYLTTAMASNRGSDFMGTNTALTANGVSMTANSSGLSLNFPAFLTTAAQSSASNVSGVIAGTGSNAATNQSAQLSGAVSFSNGSGVSFFTTANGAVSGIGATVATNYQSQGAYLTTAALSNHSHGNPTLNLTNLSGTTASNSAGLTLSLSAAAPGGGGVAISAGTQSVSTGTMVFSNSNGITFGMSGSSRITASHNGLTTAMASNRGSDFVQANAAFAGTNASGTIASNGISVSVGNYITTAMLSNAVTLSNIRVSGGTTSNLLSAVTFADSNGVSFGLNAGTLTATVKTDYQSQGAYLTTAMASNRGSDFVQANAAFAGTNASGTIASNGISVSVNPAAAGVGIEMGTRTATTAGNIRFETGNGITFGLDAVGGSVVTASHNGLTTAMASNRGSDFMGTATALTAGPLAWTANSAGLSLNAGSAAGTTSGFGGNLISGSMTHNTAGLNLSLNHPAWLTTAMQSNAATISNIRVSAGTTSNLLSALTFNNANGITFGLNASTLTASHNGLTTAALSNHSHGNPQLNLTNLSGTTASNSAGFTLSLSANGAAAGVGIEAGTRTATTAGTLRFETGNGITFGLDAVGGSVMTASHNALTTAAQSNHSHGNPTLALTNLSGTTASNSAGLTLSLSAAAGGAGDGYNIVSLGTTGTTGTAWSTASGTVAINGAGGVVVSQNNSNQIVVSGPAISSIANTGQLSMSVNGSTISLGVPEARNTQRHQWPPGQLSAVAALGNGSFSIHRMEACNPISASRLDAPLFVNIGSSAVANTWGFAVTAFAAVYTKNGATLSSLSSGSVAWSTSKASNSAGCTQLNFVGIRPMSVPININMTPGEYYIGFGISTNTSSVGTATTALGITWSIMGGLTYSSAVPHVGDFTEVTATSTGLFGGHGVYSAAISTVPPTVSLSAINQTGSYYARGAVGLIFRNQ